MQATRLVIATSWRVENWKGSMDQLVREYLDYLKNENRAVKTINNRRSILLGFCKQISLDVTYQELQEYFSRRREQLQQSSFQLEKGVIRSFFQYLQEDRGIEMKFSYAVIRRRKVKSKVQFLTREQIQKAIRKTKNPQDKLIIALLFETGIRIGELVSLRVENIIHQRIEVIGKGQKQRVVFMSEGLAGRLEHYLLTANRHTGYVFRPLQGTSVKYAVDSVRKRIEKRFAEVEITMHPHMIRHGFGTEMHQNKVDLRSIQTLMGHENISTTQIYTHVTEPFLQETYNLGMPKSVLV